VRKTGKKNRQEKQVRKIGEKIGFINETKN